MHLHKRGRSLQFEINEVIGGIIGRNVDDVFVK